MCGIFTLLNNENQLTDEFVNSEFQKGKSRGPEFSTLEKIGIKVTYGFHRLAINGLNAESNQPIKDGNIVLICNGEIYNYKELCTMMNITPNTESDCEVIIHLYKRYGIEYTLKVLDGVFAFSLLDQNIHLDESLLYVARDPYGVRPLYQLYSNVANENIIGFASELKMLSKIYNSTQLKNKYDILQFEPGTYSTYKLQHKVSANWKFCKNIAYHTTSFCDFVTNDSNTINNIISNIQK
jgi:asparagine synthase (glutamine-hydrolysing)